MLGIVVVGCRSHLERWLVVVMGSLRYGFGEKLENWLVGV